MIWLIFDPDDSSTLPRACTKNGSPWLIVRNGCLGLEKFEKWRWCERNNIVTHYGDPDQILPKERDDDKSR